MSSNQNNNPKNDSKNGKSKSPKKDRFTPLKKELDDLEEFGIRLKLLGKTSDAYTIAKVCSSVHESSSTYMREYVTNDEGEIVEINFRRIKIVKK